MSRLKEFCKYVDVELNLNLASNLSYWAERDWSNL